MRSGIVSPALLPTIGASFRRGKHRASGPACLLRGELLLAFADRLAVRDEGAPVLRGHGRTLGGEVVAGARLDVDRERLLSRIAHAGRARNAHLDLAHAGYDGVVAGDGAGTSVDLQHERGSRVFGHRASLG